MTTALLLVPPTISSATLLDNGQLRLRHSCSSSANLKRFRIRALKEKTDEIKNPTSSSSSAEEITKKYGLEAGLWKVTHFATISSLSALIEIISSLRFFEIFPWLFLVPSQVSTTFLLSLFLVLFHKRGRLGNK